MLAVIDALIANDVGAGIATINAATEAGVEPGVLAGQIVAALRALLYAAYAVPGTSENADAAIQERAGRFAPAEVAYLTKLFSQVEFRLKVVSSTLVVFRHALNLRCAQKIGPQETSCVGW